MRTFGELIGPEQVAAVEYCLTSLMRAIIEGGMRFEDEEDERVGAGLQARIDRAFAEAERMQTPWFVGEYIMEAAGGDLRAMARDDAEGTQYAMDDDGPIARLTGTLVDGFKVGAA